MVKFCKKTKGMFALCGLKENFHILLIPTRSQGGYYPVPLYGMSYFDAKRRHRRVCEQFEVRRRQYYGILREDVTPNVIICHLLGLIQENDNFGLKQSNACETYGLAELLFAMLAGNGEVDESNHDILLYHVLDKQTQDVQVNVFSMEELFYK